MAFVYSLPGSNSEKRRQPKPQNAPAMRQWEIDRGLQPLEGQMPAGEQAQQVQQPYQQRPFMYGQSAFSPAPLSGNPFHNAMQASFMGSMFAPQQMAQGVNNAMQNWQASSLLNAPQVTQRMGIAQQGQNFDKFLGILPQIMGMLGGGILGPGEQRGFQTNYGANATMGLPGILKQYQ